MGELKSIIIVIAAIGLTASMAGQFYTSMLSSQGHNATEVNTLRETSESEYIDIIGNSSEILETQQQQQETNIFTIANVFLSTGYAVVSLIISTPTTIMAMMGDIQTIIGISIIPEEFIIFIQVVVIITIFFALAKFLSGRVST